MKQTILITWTFMTVAIFLIASCSQGFTDHLFDAVPVVLNVASLLTAFYLGVTYPKHKVAKYCWTVVLFCIGGFLSLLTSGANPPLLHTLLVPLALTSVVWLFLYFVVDRTPAEDDQLE